MHLLPNQKLEGLGPVSVDDLECRICCQPFGGSGNPERLSCGHILCSQCVRKLLHFGVWSAGVRCPFCRRDTRVSLMDDHSALSRLSVAEEEPQSTDSPSCLVLTIMAAPSDHVSCVNSVSVVGVSHRHSSLSPPVQMCSSCTSRSVLNGLLGALCVVYFTSLPLGIYLLMIGWLWVGVALVTLVPFTLILLVLGAVSHCLWTQTAPPTL